MKFRLTNKTEVLVAGTSKTETAYTYEGNGSLVQFRAHPTAAFRYVILQGANDRKLSRKVIKAFVDACIRQHKYAGGFDEAIAELDVR